MARPNTGDRAAAKTKAKDAGKAEERRANPFEVRSNHKARHPALNRRIKGGNRNVGRARTQAQQKRATDLLAKIAERKTASEIVDKRFDKSHGGDQVTQEERMLQRLQRVREKKRKRSDRFQVGDEDDERSDGDEDEGLTHQGRSLSEVLDEDAVIEESEDDADVDALVERLKSGETFNAVTSQPKKQMTKREAMLDVIRKSKVLKMERQREKAEDEEERDRVDALMRDVVTAGQLAFQPTGKAKELERMSLARTEADDYERAVRELQMDRGPRAVATERVKTEEELAAEELKELERLEAERLRRAEGLDEEDPQPTEERRGKKRLRTLSGGLLAETSNDGSDASDLPFVLDCPGTHVEFLELLAAYPTADLNTIVGRIRKTTSIHLKAENRFRLGKLASILIEHIHLLGERLGQLGNNDMSHLRASPDQIGGILVHLYALASDVPREVAGGIVTQLENLRRNLDAEIVRAAKTADAAGDLGSNLRASAEARRGTGGHKDGLAEALDADAIRLSTLRCDKDIFTSPARCWPSPGHLAVIACAARLYSVSDQRHPVVSSAALLLARALVECPLRGPGDVCAALATAECLEELVRRTDVGASRFSPELLLFLRATIAQLAMQAGKTSNVDPAPSTAFVSIVTLDTTVTFAHEAFTFARVMKQDLDAKSTSLMGCFSYVRDSDWTERMAGAFMFHLRGLLSRCVESLSGLASADVLLAKMATHVRDVHTLSPLVDSLKEKIRVCQTTRSALRLQEFTPDDKSVAPRFLVDSETAKRPGEEFRGLKRQVKRERKGVARELRLDGQFVAQVRSKAKFDALQQAKAERHRNFASLENQQASFSRALKEGVALKGAGVGGLSLKGRRMGKKQLE